MPQTILIVNILATFFLTGVIWFVQIVQYPGFHKIAHKEFRQFHWFHIYRISFVVIPPMIIELGSSVWLTVSLEQLATLNAAGLALVIAIWISTFTIQLPIHRKLQANSSSKLITRLIHTNWIRTILWTAKAAFGIYILMI